MTRRPDGRTGPGVLPDIFGLRPAFRQMGRRLAESGYSVLVVNPFYRQKLWALPWPQWGMHPLSSPPMPSLPDSPAADRNKEPILALLRSVLGNSGTALEIAAGTGQHTVWFAAGLPGWSWQPTDLDPDMLPVIAARIAHSAVSNALPPLRLDVTEPRWPFTRSFDAVFCANMLHIAPWDACTGLMAGAARHLASRGVLVTYGPYFENDVPPAPSNLAFDESLRARDPSWGIRQLQDVVAEAARSGLALAQRHAMPANNLLLVFERS